VNTLSELISRRYTPEVKVRNEPTIQTLSARIEATRPGADYQYEAEVFNFFLDNKDALGIKNVLKFSALLVDGAVELVDGKRLTLEIKFCMNWHKACQAEWQFRNCLKRHHAVVGTVTGGLVLFSEFPGDWKLYPISPGCNPTPICETDHLTSSGVWPAPHQARATGRATT
jgi:hypothetical protein